LYLYPAQNCGKLKIKAIFLYRFPHYSVLRLKSCFEIVSLLTKGGSLYHLTNLMQEFSSDLEPKCDANLDRIVEASENLKKLSKEQREAEEVLKQIKLLWEIERGSGN